MFPRILSLTLAALVLSACTAEGDGKKDPPPTVQPPVKKPVQVVASKTGRLKFKAGELYAQSLASGLELPREQLCNELGLYDCVSQVHRITLGGVEPYRLGINAPLEGTAITTPVAVERVALSACEARVKMDFSEPSKALIFADWPLNNGDVMDIEAAQVSVSIQKLFQRLLQRNPEEAEVTVLKELYQQMKTVGDQELAKQWAAMSCFAVATMMEAVFY